MLGALLLALLPCSAFAGLLAISGIYIQFKTGFSVTDVPAIILFSTAVGIGVVGVRLFFGLLGGFNTRLKRKLLGFYFVTAGYCSLWTFFSFDHEGGSSSIFSSYEQALIIGFLLIPVSLTFFTPPMRAE